MDLIRSPTRMNPFLETSRYRATIFPEYGESDCIVISLVNSNRRIWLFMAATTFDFLSATRAPNEWTAPLTCFTATSSN